MRIGLANPFAYRPHVAQLVFIARQLRRLNHELHFLACDGDLPNCNSRLSRKGLAHKLECFKCRAGGFRSYLDVQLDRLDLPVEPTAEDLEIGRNCARSTVVSALQIEHPSQAAEPGFTAYLDSLSAASAVAYRNTIDWIERNRLECVFLFNGRYDLTRAILEGCRARNVVFVSVERSWFGPGLQLLPGENCIGLSNMHRLCERWASRPLSRSQAARASELMSRRLRRSSHGEWRQYNIQSTSDHSDGPIEFLLLPSSQHEWLGHPDRSSEWTHPVEGVEYLFRRLGVPLNRLLVRGHPGWSMKIKNYGPNRSNEFYRAWCARVGARYIDSSSTVNTHSLIRSAGLVLVNGSSASMEASWRGKPVVSFFPAAFTTSGISRNFFGRADIDCLNDGALEALRHPFAGLVEPAAQCRLSLRYMYCVNFRVMQFVKSVSSANPFMFDFEDPPDLSGLESLVRGVLLEDDADFAGNDREETEVVQAILADREVASEPPRSSAHVTLQRRQGYRLLDRFSS